MMKIKFKLYHWSAKFRQKEAPLFRLKAIFMTEEYDETDRVDLFMHLPLVTVGIIIYKEEKGS